MKKAYFLAPILVLSFLALSSCKKDDEVDIVPPRDRSAEVGPAIEEIETYLNTHFYNYEEFANPPVGFDNKIKFDTIAGDNALKTPLIEQVSFKNVTDLIDDTVEYKLYYLTVNEGEGVQPGFADIAHVTYEGTYLNNDSDYNRSEVFDSSVVPIEFDLTAVVTGFQEALVEFKSSSNATVNGDGTFAFEGFGVGAVFIPSGLGYYASPPSGIPLYSQLIFTFQLMEAQPGDQDEDGVPSSIENLDGDNDVFDDDTDLDGSPNFVDGDDDGDGRLTSNEVIKTEYILNPGDEEPVLGENEVETFRIKDYETQIVTVTTITFTDVDGDGTPDYLDPDN
ncbi:FKBP-type peptidyl-prolyl cis-trans isomerase [Ulvibacter litoralis]|uniref:peptidylprolyl isomerase n=1 Tax=Ulvibacter litoralis TaxID=227084 RepID=A0A1G7JDB6_9FLAO|nr:hypothetical protein [Ulvibacter litoralis]GHC64752.1 hypothetical protein GCM10008083_32510 [Ulvibacter litoralis]SDF22957.1 hypothetical protein SAMN05421855_11113 [Ulvibacter litoralis]